MRQISDRYSRIIVRAVTVLIIVAAYVGTLAAGRGFDDDITFFDTYHHIVGAATAFVALVTAAFGFSYLHSSSRVDVYHSLPITSRSRFRRIYLSGVFIYISALVISIILDAFLFGGRIGTLGGDAWSSVLSISLILLLFLSVYNITIYAFTLTGNVFIGLMIAVVLTVYIDLWERVVELLWDFAAYSPFFSIKPKGISLLDMFMRADYRHATVSTLAVLFIWAVITFLLCRSNYLKRPAEASETLVAFYSSHTLIKLMIVVPLALVMGDSTYDSFYRNRDLMQILAMIITAIIISVLVESLFSRSFAVAVRKWGSVIVSLIVIFIVYGVFKYSENRFNTYVPKAEELETYAVFDPLDSYYYDFNIAFDTAGRAYSYISAAEYVRDRMFLEDDGAILTLAAKSQKTDYHDMASPLPLQVYYRLKGGKTAARLIWVDMDDEENGQYLNRIIGPAYYKAGVWQAFDTGMPEGASVTEVYYNEASSGRQYRPEGGVTDSDVRRIVSEWKDAMVRYDYDHVRYSEIAGDLELHFEGTGTFVWHLPVYEDMIPFITIDDNAEGESTDK